MATGFFKVPAAHNEPVKSYAPGSNERDELKKKLTNDLPVVHLAVVVIIRCHFNAVDLPNYFLGKI